MLNFSLDNLSPTDLTFTVTSLSEQFSPKHENADTTCSSSLLLQLLIILTSTIGVLLIICLTLVLALCMVIHYYRRALLRLRNGNNVPLGMKVKFHSDSDRDIQPCNQHHTKSMNIYETPTSVNPSLCESLYLQSFSVDSSSLDDNLATVVTAHSFPIAIDEPNNFPGVLYASGHKFHNDEYAICISHDTETAECSHLQPIELNINISGLARGAESNKMTPYYEEHGADHERIDPEENLSYIPQ